jgi:hypothetical protein
MNVSLTRKKGSCKGTQKSDNLKTARARRRQIWAQKVKIIKVCFFLSVLGVARNAAEINKKKRNFRRK